MSASKNLIQAASGVGGGDFYPYTVDNSARFNDDDVAYVSRVATTTPNQKTFTLSCWLKRCSLSTTQTIWKGNPPSGNAYLYVFFNSTGTLQIQLNTGSVAYDYVTSMVFRDVSAWGHINIRFDTTQASGADRVRVEYNGVSVALSNGNVPQNTNLMWGDTGATAYGSYNIGSNGGVNTHGDYYLSQVAHINGQALNASYFGEDKNGVWVPKNLSGLTFGVEGFLLDFSNSGALGTDVSGNGNNFTSSGLTSSDQMIDTPTNNFATFDANYLGYFFDNGGTLTAPITTASNGNLEVSTPNSPGDGWGMYNWLNQDIVSGMKTYVEFSNLTNSQLWITRSRNKIENPGSGAPTGRIGIYSGAVMILDGASGSGSGSAVSFNSSDTIGIAVDYDADTSYWYKNGTLFWTVTNMDFSGTTYGEVDGYWIANVASSSGTTGTARVNTGQTPFTYTPPTDYEGLSTATRSEPTIGPNSDTLSGENFNVALYTGNGTSQSITGVGFQPDWVWLKARSTAQNNYSIDAIRGINNLIALNSTNPESHYDAAFRASYGNLTSFDADGFTVVDGTDPTFDSFNGLGDTYVAWNWKANGSGSSNTDGTITSTVSANTDAGFSIVKYVGTANGSSTVGHGLGVAPAFIIASPYTQGGWINYHASLGVNQFLELTSTGAAGTSTGYWGTAVNSSVFGLSAGGTNNRSGESHIAYCFAEVEGFSSFSSYKGNGNTTGPFIYTGFRPAYVMIKSSTSAGTYWILSADPNGYNVVDSYLAAQNYDAEYSPYTWIDYLSNGFKLRQVGGSLNGSGQTYIYMAFAENPFKYSNAR